MRWLLSRITNNPIVLAYVAAACFVAGLAVGAIPAWKYQAARLDAVQTRYNSFVAQTKLIGEQAAKEAEAKTKSDKLKKEKSDVEFKKLAAANTDLAKRLLDARTSGSYLPAPSPGSGRIDRACFNRTELDGAIRRLDERVSGIVEKGNAARIGLDTARVWAQER